MGSRVTGEVYQREKPGNWCSGSTNLSSEGEGCADKWKVMWHTTPMREHPGDKFMKSILLVDDSATVLLSTSSILAKAGYEVSKAASGAEALKLLQGGLVPNLVITDLNMPGMNGIEFIRNLRGLPAHKFVPILFLTTESQQAKRAEAKAAGASGWLVKPVTADELLSTIRLVMK